MTNNWHAKDKEKTKTKTNMITNHTLQSTGCVSFMGTKHPIYFSLTLSVPGGGEADLPLPRANGYTCKKSIDRISVFFSDSELLYVKKHFNNIT